MGMGILKKTICNLNLTKELSQELYGNKLLNGNKLKRTMHFGRNVICKPDMQKALVSYYSTGQIMRTKCPLIL